MPGRMLPPLAATLKAPPALPAAPSLSKFHPQAELLQSIPEQASLELHWTAQQGLVAAAEPSWTPSPQQSLLCTPWHRARAAPARQADKLTSWQLIAQSTLARRISIESPHGCKIISPQWPCLAPGGTLSLDAPTCRGTAQDTLSGSQLRRLKHWNPLAVTPRSGLRKLATWVNVRGSCTYYISIIFWQTFPSIMRYRKRGSAL